MAEALSKVGAKKACEIYQHYDIDEECLALDEGGKATPLHFIKALMDNKRYEHAVAFLAHALPKRESVWWACVSARSVVAEGDGILDVALKSAEKWVYEPTEPNRRAAEKLAEKTKYKHPASWAAMAAFWSGSSITGEDEPPVPPPPFLFAHAVSGAITLAAVGTDPDAAPGRFELFIRQGLDIGQGGNGRIS